MILNQKRGQEYKNFELKNDILNIKEKSHYSTKEWSINIEEIGFDKLVEIHSGRGIKILGLIFFLISIISFYCFLSEENINGKFDGLLWGSLGMVVLGIITYKMPLNNSIVLNGGREKITFFLKPETREEVENFVDDLIEKSKKKLIAKYTRVDTDLSEEGFINQLNWLLNNNIITLEFYDEKKNEYKIASLVN